MGTSVMNEYKPVTVTHPSGTLQDLLEERGMTALDLAEKTNQSEKIILSILDGESGITSEIANQLEIVFDIPASFWINRQRRYDEALANQKGNQRLEQ